MQRFPVVTQAVYSQLVSSLVVADKDPYRDGGTFVSKDQGERTYWYLQTKVDGHVKRRYLGPESDSLLEQIRKDEVKLGEGRERAAQRRKLVRQLRAADYNAADALSGRTLARLAGAGLFRAGAVLVGTHAFRTYDALLGVALPQAAGVTGDLDIARSASVDMAVAESQVLDTDFASVLKEVDERFEPVMGFERPPKPVGWTLPSGDFSVELLTPNTGRERTKPVHLEALKAYATPLRFLDYLIQDTQHAAILWRTGVLVRVPLPTRFALHKLIVAQRRRQDAASTTKAAKDIAQADALLGVLLQDRPDELEEDWRELLSRGSAWRKAATSSLARLTPHHAQALKEWSQT